MMLTFLGVGFGINSVVEASSIGSKVTWSGDIRVRDQQEKIENSDIRLRERLRVRLRSNLEVSDATNVTIGFSSGSTDPRSDNQTIENSFQKIPINLNLAYIKHKLGSDMTVFAGKMKNLIWKPSDLLWDSDINPDGLAVQIRTMDNKLRTVIGSFRMGEFEKNKVPGAQLLAVQ